MNLDSLQSWDYGSWVLPGLVLLGQVTLLALGGVVASRLYRRDAATRHAVACVALLGILGAPLVTSLCQRGGWRLWSVGERVVVPAVSQREETASPVPVGVRDVVTNPGRPVVIADPVEEESVIVGPEGNADVASPVAVPAIVAPAVRKPWVTLVGIVQGFLAVWIVGTVFLLGRLGIGFVMARRLVCASVPLDQERMFCLTEKFESQFDASAPRVLVHDSIGTALAAGIVNRVVILPRRYVETLSGEELEAVVTHEMAHLARRDPAVGLLQRIAAALYWPHPLVHGLNREISRAREEICDNFVLRQQPSVSYAELLLRLVGSHAESRSSAQPAGWTISFIDSRWKLEDRIAGILDPRRLVAVVSRRRLWGAAGIVAVCLTAVLAGIRSPQVERETATASPAGASTSCRVTFSDGSQLELLGVGEYPSNESAWWRPDGSVLEMKPKQPGPGLTWMDKSKVGRGFSFANSGFDLNSTLQIVGQSSEIEGGNVKGTQETLRRLITSERIFDQKEESATIMVEYSSAPWKTIHEWNAKSGQGLIQMAKEEMVAYNTAGERDGGTLVSATYRLLDHQTARIVAVDQEGKDFTEGAISRMEVGNQRGLTMMNVVISRLPLAKVKTFRFQTRKLETVEFRGVSLQRGRKSEVAVFLNGKRYVDPNQHVSTLPPNVELITEDEYSALRTLCQMPVAHGGEMVSRASQIRTLEEMIKAGATNSPMIEQLSRQVRRRFLKAELRDIPKEGWGGVGKLQFLDEIVITNSDFPEEAWVSIGRLQKLKSFEVTHPKSLEPGIESLANLHDLKLLFLDCSVLPGISPDKGGAEVLTEDEGRWLTSYFEQSGPHAKEDVVRRAIALDRLLKRLSGLKHLELLQLSNGLITGRGIQALAAFPRLRLLDVGMLEMSVEDARILGKLESLQTLNKARLSDATLAEMTGLKNLVQLDGWSEGVTDAGLDSLLKMTSLKTLALRGSPLTDDGAMRFAGLKSLRRLDVSHAKKITAEGLEKFRKARPDCEILVQASDEKPLGKTEPLTVPSSEDSDDKTVVTVTPGGNSALPAGAKFRLGGNAFKHQGDKQVAFSADGKVLASVGGREIKFWNVQNGELLRTTTSSHDYFLQLCVTPDRKHLVTLGMVSAVGDIGSNRGVSLCVWDFDSGELEKRHLLHKEEVASYSQFTLSPDGTVAFLADRRGELHFFDLQSGRKLPEKSCKIKDEGFRGGFNGIAVSSDGRHVALTGQQVNRGYLWDRQSGENPVEIADGGRYEGVAFSPDGKLVALGLLARKHVQLYDVATKQLVRSFAGAPMFTVKQLRFTPDCKYLIAANSVMRSDQVMAGVYVWEVATGELRQKLVRRGCFPTSIDLSPNGELIAAGDLGAEVSLWNLKSGESLPKDLSNGHASHLRSLSFSPTSRYVLTTSADASARVWDAKSGKEVATLNHEQWVNTAAASADETLIATSSDDDKVYLWEMPAGKLRYAMKNGNERLMGAWHVAFSPDQQEVIVIKDNLKLQVWGVSDGKLRREEQLELKGLDLTKSRRSSSKELTRETLMDVVTAHAFSSTGDRLIAAGQNRYWNFDLTGGQKVVQFPLALRDIPFSSNPQGMAMSQDGKRLAFTTMSYPRPQIPRGQRQKLDDRFPPEVIVVERETGKELWRKDHYGFSSCPVAFSPDGKELAIGPDFRYSTTIDFVEAETGKLLRKIEGGQPGSVGNCGLAFSPDGRQFAAIQRDATVIVWDIDTLKTVALTR